MRMCMHVYVYTFRHVYTCTHACTRAHPVWFVHCSHWLQVRVNLEDADVPSQLQHRCISVGGTGALAALQGMAAMMGSEAE